MSTEEDSMEDNEPDMSQLRFEDGTLVDPSSGEENHDLDDVADPIEPGYRTGFAVGAKPGALGMNETLVDDIESHGRIQFGGPVTPSMMDNPFNSRDFHHLRIHSTMHSSSRCYTPIRLQNFLSCN